MYPNLVVDGSREHNSHQLAGEQRQHDGTRRVDGAATGHAKHRPEAAAAGTPLEHERGDTDRRAGEQYMCELFADEQLEQKTRVLTSGECGVSGHAPSHPRQRTSSGKNRKLTVHL